jgi:hypothetical protein
MRKRRLKMQFKTWQEFFEAWDKNRIDPYGITIEEFYQQFKARLMDEVVVKHVHKEESMGHMQFYDMLDLIDNPLKNKGG